MIQDIKKYNVWLVYVCMWVFSFFTVWYTAIVMYYTLVHVTKSGYASDFIKKYIYAFQCSNAFFLYLYIYVYCFILFCVHSSKTQIFLSSPNDSYLY